MGWLELVALAEFKTWSDSMLILSSSCWMPRLTPTLNYAEVVEQSVMSGVTKS